MLTNPDDDLLSDDESLRLIKRRSARGAVATFLAQICKFILTFGSQLALARLLSPAQFGIVAMAGPVLGFVGIFNTLGLSQAIIQRKEISQAELSSLFWMNLGISAFLAALVALVSPFVGWLYGEPQVTPVLIALGGLLLFSSLGAQSSALLNRRMQFNRLAALDLLTTAAGVAVGISAALLGCGYWSLVITQGVTTVVAQISAWIFAGWRPSRPAYDKGVLSMLAFGGYLTTFNVVSFFSAYFDNVLVGIMNGPQALGLFDRAFKLMNQPMTQITSPVNNVAVPTLSRLIGRGDSYRKTYVLMLQLILSVTIPGLVCASVMSHELVVGLLGQSWAGAAPILVWLNIAGMFSVYTGSTYWIFVSQNRPKEQMSCGFISSFLILVSLLVGLHWGPVGIAAAYAAFAPLVHGVFVWVATRRGPVSLTDVVAGSYPVWLAALGVALVLIALKPHLAQAPWTALLSALAIAYVTAGLVIGCTPAGWKMLRNVWGLRSIVAAR